MLAAIDGNDGGIWTAQATIHLTGSTLTNIVVMPANPLLSAPLAVGATYRVVDASPFPPPCIGPECVVAVPRAP